METQVETVTTPSQTPTAAIEKSGVVREIPETTDSRKSLVKEWISKVKSAKAYHKDAFDRIREDMDFVYLYGTGKQWQGQGKDDDRYIANFVQRHLSQTVSVLYAKDPKAVAKRRQRLDFKVWDGSAAALEMALQDLQMNPVPNPMSVMLLKDVQQVSQFHKMLKRMGETLEILFNYYLEEQDPEFKEQMKQAVLRAKCTGVAYVRLGFQRVTGHRPETTASLADMMEHLQTIERMQADLQDEKVSMDSATAEELRLAIGVMQSQPEIILREGLTFDFPDTTAIIIDPRCRNINGFVRARWVAEEFRESPEEIQELSGIDVGTNYISYVGDKAEDQLFKRGNDAESIGAYATRWRIYDKQTGMAFSVVDGYPDFIEEPAAPEIAIEQFFPFFPIIFNKREHPRELYPASDPRLLTHQQREYNRKGEAARQHRIANRPLYGAPRGALGEEDQASLMNYPAHAVVLLDGLKEGQDVGKLLQPVQKVPVDPNLYESEGTFQDAQRVVGSQEANMGGTSNATATESGIAEGSRVSGLQSNIDDLDSVLTRLAKAGGQVMLQELQQDTVIEIVGQGAVWPSLSRSQVMKEVWLEIKGGSSGRPNKAAEAAIFERLAPLILQVPGIAPDFLAARGIRIMDDDFDLEEAMIAGLPSITAMNANAQPAVSGNAMEDPNQQGGQGGNNAALPPRPQGSPRPQTPPPPA